MEENFEKLCHEWNSNFRALKWKYQLKTDGMVKKWRSDDTQTQRNGCDCVFTIVKYVPHQERSSVTAFWILCVCTVEAKVVWYSWRDLHLEWRTLKQSHSRCKSHKIFYGILKVLAIRSFQVSLYGLKQSAKYFFLLLYSTYYNTVFHKMRIWPCLRASNGCLSFFSFEDLFI